MIPDLDTSIKTAQRPTINKRSKKDRHDSKKTRSSVAHETAVAHAYRNIKAQKITLPKLLGYCDDTTTVHLTLMSRNIAVALLTTYCAHQYNLTEYIHDSELFPIYLDEIIVCSASGCLGYFFSYATAYCLKQCFKAYYGKNDDVVHPELIDYINELKVNYYKGFVIKQINNYEFEPHIKPISDYINEAFEDVAKHYTSINEIEDKTKKRALDYLLNEENLNQMDNNFLVDMYKSKTLLPSILTHKKTLLPDNGFLKVNKSKLTALEFCISVIAGLKEWLIDSEINYRAILENKYRFFLGGIVKQVIRKNKKHLRHKTAYKENVDPMKKTDNLTTRARILTNNSETSNTTSTKKEASPDWEKKKLLTDIYFITCELSGDEKKKWQQFTKRTKSDNGMEKLKKLLRDYKFSNYFIKEVVELSLDNFLPLDPHEKLPVKSIEKKLKNIEFTKTSISLESTASTIFSELTLSLQSVDHVKLYLLQKYMFDKVEPSSTSLDPENPVYEKKEIKKTNNDKKFKPDYIDGDYEFIPIADSADIIHGGIKYVIEIINPSLNCPERIKTCLNSIKNNFDMGKGQNTKYQTEISYNDGSENHRVYHVSSGIKGASGKKCTLFFIAKGGQVKIIAAGTHITKTTDSYSVKWDLPSIQVPGVICISHERVLLNKT